MSNNKGKEKYIPSPDAQQPVATGWSDWTWDDTIRDYTCYRINSTGAMESVQQNPPPQVPRQWHIPRSSSDPSQDLSHQPGSYGSDTDGNYMNSYRGSVNQAPSLSTHTDFPPRSVNLSPWSYQNISLTPGYGSLSLNNTNNTLYGSWSQNSGLPPTIGRQAPPLMPPYTSEPPPNLDSINQGFQEISFSPHPTLRQAQPQSGAFQGGPPQGPSPLVDVYPNSKLIQSQQETAKAEQLLDPRYREVSPKQSRDFWKAGRVFMMLWTEPAGEKSGKAKASTHLSRVAFGEKAFSKIRIFVVVQDLYGCCICLAIHTYSGRATLKPNLPDPENHAIIYTSNKPPEPHSERLKNGTIRREQLVKDAIKVNGTKNYAEGHLDPKSRINFTKIYTVEKNVRVLSVGVVHSKSMRILEHYSPVKGPPASLPPVPSPIIEQGEQSRQLEDSDSDEETAKEDQPKAGVVVHVSQTSGRESNTKYENAGQSSSRGDSRAKRPSHRRRNSEAQQPSSSQRDKSPPHPGSSSKQEPKPSRRRGKN